MSRNWLILLAIFCLLQVSLSYCLPRSLKKAHKLVNNDSNESSEEDLTEQDVQDLKSVLAKSLPPDDVEKAGNVFSKFTAGRTDEEKLAGIVSCFLYIYMKKI